MPPALEIFFFVVVFLALDLFASAAAATASLLQFNTEANARRYGLGVGGGKGRVRCHEAVDETAEWEVCSVPSPGLRDSPPCFSTSARPFLSTAE